MSLRLKLLVAVIVLVFVGLTVSDVVTYTSLRSFLVQRVDQQLASGWPVVAQAIYDPHDAQQPGGPFGTSPLPAGTYGLLVDGQGHQLAPAVWLYGQKGPKPSIPITKPSDDSSLTVGCTPSAHSSQHYRVLVKEVHVGQPGFAQRAFLIVAVPLNEVGQTLRRLLLIEGLVSLLVLLGLASFSWWLVRHEMRPLEEIGVTAGAIAAGDLSRRVPQEDPRTEVGRLGVALNAMLAQIEHAFGERKASEDRLRRFLADASHELRTPLTSIRGYAELFRRGAAERPSDLEKSMRRIEDEAARMGIMVEDLLLLARLDQDRPLEREPVDLAALAADAVEDARASDGERPIELDAAPVTVTGDEARLRQVAANLLANALVHTPAGTPVAVRTYPDGDNAVLEVADRGPGLAPEQIGRVFEPFYRSDPSRDRTTGGAGLGLAIVETIARAHRGRVEVVTTPGGGATFRVLLPRTEG